MAHFAKISENNEILQVVVVENKNLLDENQVEQESIGQTHLERCCNWPANLWIQTSYNKNFRINYAGIGGLWHPEHNFFTGPKPYPSWILNTTKGQWQSPIGDAPVLTDEQKLVNHADTENYYSYKWNEVGQSWDLVTYPPV